MPIKALTDFLKKQILGAGKTAVEEESISVPVEEGRVSEFANSITRVLMGEPGVLGEFYFPSELIGGCCPRVVGNEEEIVWNAAAEACDTERVHVIWESVGDKIWYLAVRSSELSSHPQTWCPFASLLPGMKDAVASPVCYVYFDVDAAAMMTVTAEGLQIYRGTNQIVRAKAERTARELGDAPVIDLVPDRILGLTPAPWYSVSLFEDRARRILAATALLGALGFAGLSFLVWFFASMSLIAARSDLTDTLARTEGKTMELMRLVENIRASPMRDQVAKFSEINDELLSLNGYLEVYEIKDGKQRWRATLPSNVTADRISALGGLSLETRSDGDVVIGNAAEKAYEASLLEKK